MAFTHTLETALALIDFNGPLWNGTPCWVWKGNINSDSGYGRVSINKEHYTAHRLVYELCKGPISEGLDPDHLCRNRACCNPDHLEPVTRQVNLLRGDTIPAKHAAKDCCPKGHPYDEVNTYIERHKSGRRMRHCRTCHREDMRMRRANVAS